MSDVLVVTCNEATPLARWQSAFAHEGGGVTVRDIADESLLLKDVAYALCFRPTPGRLAAFDNLRLIVSLGAGVDHMIADPALPKLVPIVRMATDRTRSQMADYVTWACLSLLRDLPRLVQGHRARRWTPFTSERTVGDCRVGILGLGAMGGAAAVQLVAAGFRVAGWSRTPRQIEGVVSHVGADGLRTMAHDSDILVCSLPSSADLAGIVDRALIALLPPEAGVVNVGRSEQVVLTDLLAALDSGHLRGAILDVVPHEPLPAADTLWDHPGLFLTPHLASIVSVEAAAHHTMGAIAALREGQPLPYLFDRSRGY